MERDRSKPIPCVMVYTILMLALALNVYAEEGTIVETKQGKVKGYQLHSGSVIAYLGIPYGEPPTGTHRFKKPEPRKPWEGVYDASKFGKSCYQKRDEAFASFPGTNMWQVNNEMSEDCLYLNVWVPSSKPKSAQVMVFIYGGAFLAGTSSLEVYDPSILAFSEDIILVSMNYRVGALGFLALPGNKDIPGNAGMFDQQLALQWVHENIAAFGGNPDSVTLFGHSSGAACVGLHLLSPGSQHFFNRAIMQSGSVSAGWAISTHKRAKRLTLKLAELLACPVDDEDALAACLQNTDPTKIVEKQFFVEIVHPFALTRIIPVIDFDFISDMPNNALKQTLKKTEILIGGTKDDGNPFTIWGAPGFRREHDSLINTEQLIQGITRFFPTAGDIGTEVILFEYKDWEDEQSMEKNREAMELILRDYYMICPMKYFTDEMVKHKTNVYFYEFNHRSSQEIWPEWMGVLHGAILPFMFGKPLSKGSNFTEEEQMLSKRIMKVWGNFARTGIPHDDDDNAFTWSPYTDQEQNYVVMKTGNWEVQRNLYSRRCHFWNSFLPKLVDKVGKSFDGNLWSYSLNTEQSCRRDAHPEESSDSCQSV
ncbi:acetylcholinesterase-like [Hyla sarda]|uniref:acetylcholinesterase-like n=1 Tax=Hyla sarda TaxID=327740 RepID=UPI0024C30A2B|nr:acetylcholinesterase-like [Hyla sarda]